MNDVEFKIFQIKQKIEDLKLSLKDLEKLIYMKNNLKEEVKEDVNKMG